MSEEQEDFLSVDNPIPGQNYVCLSIVCPEDLVADKHLFTVKNFLNNILSDIDKKNLLLSQKELTYEHIDDMYSCYMLDNEENLNKQYDEIVDFKTSMRCVKVRGVYDTIKEAKFRAKQLRDKDKNFHVFVAQVGYWLPIDADPNKMQNQEYANTQQNTMMKKYLENKRHQDIVFDKETKEKIARAKAQNNKTKEQEQREQENIEKIRVAADAKEGNIEMIENNTVVKDIKDDTLEEQLSTTDPWMERKEEGNNVVVKDISQ